MKIDGTISEASNLAQDTVTEHINDVNDNPTILETSKLTWWWAAAETDSLGRLASVALKDIL